jgi:hypothetical protein
VQTRRQVQRAVLQQHQRIGSISNTGLLHSDAAMMIKGRVAVMMCARGGWIEDRGIERYRGIDSMEVRRAP